MSKWAALPTGWAAFRKRRKTLLTRDGMRRATAFKIADREARTRQTAAAMLGNDAAMRAIFLCLPSRHSDRLCFKLVGNDGGSGLPALAAALGPDALLLGPMATGDFA